MARMDGLDPVAARLFEAKERRRKALAALPWPEKVKAIVKLQEAVEPLLRSRNPRLRVWRLAEGVSK